MVLDMATIVFAGGHTLKVRGDPSTLVQRISTAARGGENLNLQFTDGKQVIVQDWFSVTQEDGEMLPVRPDTVAYVLP